MRTISRAVVLFIHVALLVPLVVLGEACGGCPWTSHSDVTVTPEMSCLDLSVADSNGEAPSTGCVDPVLYGRNNCSAPLVLPAAASIDGSALEVAPNTSFVFEISLDYCHYEEDTYHASIPATVGPDDIVIEFDLSSSSH